MQFEDGRTGMVAADLRIDDAKTFRRRSRARRRDDERMRDANARSATSILKLENISLAFGGVKALTDISFDVREHEIRAIIGPNGAGKSSMLNVINGVYRPQQGTITFRGEVRRDMDPHDAGGAGHRAHVPEHRAVQGHDACSTTS